MEKHKGSLWTWLKVSQFRRWCVRIGKCQMLISCLCCGSPDKCRWVTQDLVNDMCKVRMLKDLRYITSADPQVYTIVFGCSLAAPAPGCCWSSQRSGHCWSLCQQLDKLFPVSILASICDGCVSCLSHPQVEAHVCLSLCFGKVSQGWCQGNDTCGSGTSFASSPQWAIAGNCGHMKYCQNQKTSKGNHLTNLHTTTWKWTTETCKAIAHSTHSFLPVVSSPTFCLCQSMLPRSSCPTERHQQKM